MEQSADRSVADITQPPHNALQVSKSSISPACCNRSATCRCRVEASRARILRDILDASNPDLSGPRGLFVPRGAILHILDRRRVALHLETLSYDQPVLSPLAARISPERGQRCHCGSERCTGSRIIFACLLRIGKEDLITRLHERGSPEACDASLPFLGLTPFPEAFDDLTEKEQQLFSHSQCEIRAHFLKRLRPDETELTELDDEAALPLLSIDNLTSPIIGEHSFVRRVRFHPDHHDLDENQCDFVLKTFDARRYSQEALEEFLAYRQAPRHERIVPLLGAVKHRHKIHLIFPWASGGDLQQLWERYPSNPDSASAPWYSPQWLIEECLGIAESVDAIHRPATQTQLRTQPAAATPQLHTDIKPRNIICFETQRGGRQSFTLKLADLGLARKLDPDGRVATRHMGHTKTYRPPEYDLRDRVGLQIDIWCLACVYLGFMTWAILGNSGLKTFETERLNEQSDPRTSEARGDDFEDTFFKKSARSFRWPSGLKLRIERNSEATPQKNAMSRVLVLRARQGGIQVDCKVKDSVTEGSNLEKPAYQITPKADPLPSQVL
ncbi:protein kinase-like protein [Xylariomycetidae sp. FL2044]|nr:protein kinase-like protein [Xylariomycetidae sp. FL2044]